MLRNVILRLLVRPAEHFNDPSSCSDAELKTFFCLSCLTLQFHCSLLFDGGEGPNSSGFWKLHFLSELISGYQTDGFSISLSHLVKLPWVLSFSYYFLLMLGDKLNLPASSSSTQFFLLNPLALTLRLRRYGVHFSRWDRSVLETSSECFISLTVIDIMGKIICVWLINLFRIFVQY